LYFIPIIVAGFWFGLKGGLAVAAIISLLYFPFAVGGLRNIGEHQFGNLLEIILFSVIGALVGWMQDRELRRQAEQRQEEALIKTGKAVSCIAHDMKTPLMAIGGFAIQLGKSFKTDAKTKKKLQIIIHQTRRLEKMIQDMLRFTKPLELECEPNDLDRFLDETLLLIQEKAMSHEVKVSVEKSACLPSCKFDYHRLQRALLNLIANAIEASPPERNVVLRCDCSNDDQSILFEIEDFGAGLKDMGVNDMFEPFITSKKDGTGLGLSIVKKIVEAHGGVLEYEQKNNGGMIFRMLIVP
jgi:signal transduction histidine kinase